MASQYNHPYYPVDAQIPGYSPNGTSLLTLLASGAAASAALLGVTLVGISLTRPNLRKADRVAILWFVLCMKDLASHDLKLCSSIIAGTLHCFFEGYFIFNHDRMGAAQDLVGQLWKEYALSDSRYMTSDTLVLCMETITVVS